MATVATILIEKEDRDLKLFGINYVKFLHKDAEGNYLLQGTLNGYPVSVKRRSVPKQLEKYLSLITKDNRTWVYMKL